MRAKSKIFSVMKLLCVCLTLSACPAGTSEPGGASAPAVVHDSTANRFFAAYVKAISGKRNQWRISGRFIDSAGRPIGSELVVSESGQEYFCPSVAYDVLNQRFLVVWNGSNALFGQLLNTDGSLYGNFFTLSTNAGARRCSSIAYDENEGSFLAAWGERNSRNFDSLYVQRITAEGGIAGSAILVSESAATGLSPALVYDALNRRFFCSWESGGHGIRGCIINPDGSFAVPEFLISSASGMQYRPSAAHDMINSRFLVTWEESDAATNAYSLKGQVLTAEGAPFSAYLAISAEGRDVLYHGSAYDPADRKYFVIFGESTVNNERIYGQVLTADGTTDTTVSIANLMLSRTEYQGNRRPAIALDAVNHRYLAIWVYGLTGVNYPDQQKYGDIHGRLVNADGTPFSDIFVVGNGGIW